MRRVAVWLAVVIFLLDLASKWWVVHHPSLHYRPVVSGCFAIEYTLNRGIAFGLFHHADYPWKTLLLALIALAALGFVTYYLLTVPDSERIFLLALGFLMGGVLGNLADRLHDAAVVDFLKLHWGNRFAWPTFNIADAAITIGVFLILIDTLLPRRGKGAAASGLIVGLLAVGTSRAQESPPAMELAERIQHRYDTVNTVEAQFEQVVRDRLFEQRESGIVRLKRPGRMYWEYLEPTRKIFVADGKRTYFYVPRDRQVMISNLDLDVTSSPLLLLFGEADLRRDFQIEAAPEELSNSLECLRLTPRELSPEYSYAIVCVDRDNLQIRRLTVVDPLGQVQEYYLTEVRENVNIPDSQFQFRIPPNVEVIQEE